MNPIFSITVKDIQSLSDEQSRELVAHLCKAELRKIAQALSKLNANGNGGS